MEATLKYASLISLIFLNALYIHDFLKLSPNTQLTRPNCRRIIFGIHLFFSSALVCYLLLFHNSAFLFKISDFLLLIAWGVAMVSGVFEWKYPLHSLGVFILPVPLVLIFVSIYSLNLNNQNPEVYTGGVFLLHVAFYLAGYICAFFLFLISIVYYFSLNWFKQKKVDFLIKKLPPLALQQNQINLFLTLTFVFLTLGLSFGWIWWIWVYDLKTFSEEILLKIIISSLAALAFGFLLIARRRYAVSFRKNIILVSVGCLFLIISLIIGKHGV